MDTDFPFEFHPLENDLTERFSDAAKNRIFVGPKRYCFHKQYQPIAGHLHNLKIRPSDVWINGYPRSGTTMTQEITWLIGNDLNYEKAAHDILDVRFAFYEQDMPCVTDCYDDVLRKPQKYKDYLIPIVEKLKTPNWIILEKTTKKRFVKTHLPFSLGPRDILTSGCKILFLARNPKDVIVSNYELFGRSLGTLLGEYRDFEQFWNEFKRGIVACTPYFEHLKEGWLAAKTHPNNVMFLFFEEYRTDLRNTIVKIANFLDKKLTERDLDKLEEHMKIENFRKNKSVNNDYLRDLGSMSDEPDRFIRSGKVDGWKEYLTDTVSIDMDHWIQNNLEDPELADLEFPHL